MPYSAAYVCLAFRPLVGHLPQGELELAHTSFFRWKLVEGTAPP
jgi:hypothetical protein